MKIFGQNNSEGSKTFRTEIIMLIVFGAALTYLLFDAGVFYLAGRGPESLHFLRQTDGLSFVMRYYKENLSLLNPGLYNLDPTDGRGVSEFPFFYWLCAKLYHFTGVDETLLRKMNLVMFYLACFAVYRVFFFLFRDRFTAACVALMMVCSTILLNYSANYIPDINAFCLNMYGWYFFLKNYNTQKRFFLFPAFFFFVFGALLKVTTAVHFIVAVATLFYTRRRADLLFHLTLALGSVLTIGGWIVFIKTYNSHWQHTYFLTQVLPIWSMNSSQIEMVIRFMREVWYLSYFRDSVWIFVFVFTLIIPLLIRKSNYKKLVPFVLLFMGGVCYILLYFPQFRDHDYYFISFLPLLFALPVAGFMLAGRQFDRILNSVPAKIVLLLWVFIACQDTARATKSRILNSKDYYHEEGKKFAAYKSTLTKYIDSIGTPIIATKFGGYSGALYSIDRKGYMIWSMDRESDGQFRRFYERGAKLIIISSNLDVDTLYTPYFERELFKDTAFTVYSLKQHDHISGQ